MGKVKHEFKILARRNLTGRDQVEDGRVDGMTISKRIFKDSRCTGVNWIHQAKNRDQWRALVK
jgi:hypothetical protein